MCNYRDESKLYVKGSKVRRVYTFKKLVSCILMLMLTTIDINPNTRHNT